MGCQQRAAMSSTVGVLQWKARQKQ
jgi:hypothetical protein